MEVTDHAKHDDNEDATELAKVHLRVPACSCSLARIPVLLYPPALVVAEYYWIAIQSKHV